MNNRFIIFATVTIIILLTVSIGGQNISAYTDPAKPPSFGGGTYLKYSDGLAINGEAIDASRYSQKMLEPKILPLGESSTITLKIFDNRGPDYIYDVGIYIHHNGPDLSVSNADISIVYFLDKQHLTVTDHNKFLSKVTVDYKKDGPVMYATFHITPISKLHKSDLSLAAMNYKGAYATSLVMGAIQFS